MTAPSIEALVSRFAEQLATLTTEHLTEPTWADDDAAVDVAPHFAAVSLHPSGGFSGICSCGWRSSVLRELQVFALRDGRAHFVAAHGGL